MVTIFDISIYLLLPSAMKVNGHALRAIRERSGMSVSELARQAGTSQPHLSNIEGGRRSASPALLLQLAEVLKVPVLALLADPDGADLQRLGPNGT